MTTVQLVGELTTAILDANSKGDYSQRDALREIRDEIQMNGLEPDRAEDDATEEAPAESWTFDLHAEREESHVHISARIHKDVFRETAGERLKQAFSILDSGNPGDTFAIRLS